MKDWGEAFLVTGIIWLCKFIDWLERREQRSLAFDQDWQGQGKVWSAGA